eukprot:SAG25_NODE_463_length_7790_cov_6.841654_11_plen_51_part_00
MRIVEPPRDLRTPCTLVSVAVSGVMTTTLPSVSSIELMGTPAPESALSTP